MTNIPNRGESFVSEDDFLGRELPSERVNGALKWLSSSPWDVGVWWAPSRAMRCPSPFRLPSNQFPWSTFLINVSGSALLGFLLVLLIEQFPRGRLVRPLVGSGVIGAYTTFSTFEVDTLLLFRGHQFGLGIIYLVSSLLAGLAAVWLGMNLARFFIKAEQWLQGEL